MLPKMRESMMVEAMAAGSPLMVVGDKFARNDCGLRRHERENRLRFQQYGPVNHLAVDLRRAFAGFHRGDHAPCPMDLGGGRDQGLANSCDLLGMNAQLCAVAKCAREREISEEAPFVTDGWRDAGDRRSDARTTRRERNLRRLVYEAAIVA